MSSQPLVSVIIVNYNAGDLLTKAVASVIKFPQVEVIVVDNASRDDSIATLKKTLTSPKLKIILNQDNLGFAKAVNQAARYAQGEYLYLLNPDASLSQRTLSRLVATARRYSNKVIVAPRLQNPDGTPQPSCYQPQTIGNAFRQFILGHKNAYSKFLPVSSQPTPVYAAVAAAWLVPLQIWRQLQGLNEKFFLYFEDLDFCDRLHQAGYQVIYDPQAVVVHHHGVSSKTNPIVLKLFTQSALKYHGRLKKYLIDFFIYLSRLFSFPITIKKAFILTLLFFLLLTLIAIPGYFLLPERYAPLPFLHPFWKNNFLFWSWANFDGEHYLSIAKYGYHIRNGFPQYAFFPLYPLLLKATSFFLFGDLLLSAHLLSFLFTMLFIYFFARYLSSLKLTHPVFILLLALFLPGAVFLRSAYTESLFLFLTSATLAYLADKQPFKALIFAILASATRPNGVFLSLLFFPKIGFMLLSLLGLLIYMLFLYLQTGSPFTFITAQGAWHKAHLSIPWHLLPDYWRTLTVNFHPDLVHLTVIIEVFTFFLLTFLIIQAWRSPQFNLPLKLFLLANYLLPLSTGTLGSLPRFALVFFPALVVFDSLSSKKLLYLLFLFILIASLGTLLFTRGYWYA